MVGVLEVSEGERGGKGCQEQGKTREVIALSLSLQ